MAAGSRVSLTAEQASEAGARVTRRRVAIAGDTWNVSKDKRAAAVWLVPFARLLFMRRAASARVRHAPVERHNSRYRNSAQAPPTARQSRPARAPLACPRHANRPLLTRHAPLRLTHPVQKEKRCECEPQKLRRVKTASCLWYGRQWTRIIWEVSSGRTKSTNRTLHWTARRAAAYVEIAWRVLRRRLRAVRLFNGVVKPAAFKQPVAIARRQRMRKSGDDSLVTSVLRRSRGV